MWVSNSLLPHKVWFAPNVSAEYAAKLNIAKYAKKVVIKQGYLFSSLYSITCCIYLNVCVMKFEIKVSKEAKFSGKVK